MRDNGTVQVYKLLESEKWIVMECRLVGLWVTTRFNSYKSSGSLYNEIKSKFQIIGAETRTFIRNHKEKPLKSCEVMAVPYWYENWISLKQHE
jgi:hypothetical protein